MPSLTLPDRLIWFAHCPKAGGTSVETALVETWGSRVGHLSWGWQRRRRRGGWRGDCPRTSPQHMIWAEAESLLPFPPDAVFALVRDPVARMESEYRWQRGRRDGTRAGKLLAYLPFPVWLRLMLALARHDPEVFDNHFRAQSDFVPDHARVFRLEDGTKALSLWLGEVAGQTVDVPHRLKGDRTVLVATSACRARIARAFADDYARFGYPAPPAPPSTAAPGDRLCEALAPILAWLDRRAIL